MAIQDFLTDDEIISRRALGSENEYGETAATWPTVGTIKGIIQPRSGDLARDDSGKAITGDGMLYCLAGANIQVDDRVTDPYGVLWIVTAVLNESGKSHHYKCVLKLIK